MKLLIKEKVITDLDSVAPQKVRIGGSMELEVQTRAGLQDGAAGKLKGPTTTLMAAARLLSKLLTKSGEGGGEGGGEGDGEGGGDGGGGEGGGGDGSGDGGGDGGGGEGGAGPGAPSVYRGLSAEAGAFREPAHQSPLRTDSINPSAPQ